MVDGVPIFEKSKTGRHARSGEIAQLIAKAQNGAHW
jgi:hypothetical protein